MVLTKICDKYHNDYIEMSIEMFSSGATNTKVDINNFENTYNEIVSGSALCDGYVFLHEGKVCGYTQISFSWNNDLGGKSLWIEEIFIKSEFRSLGIGKKAIDKIFEIFKDDVKAFRLEVTEENLGAIKLYERLGFKQRKYKQYFKEN